MTIEEVKKLLDRIRRITARIQAKVGEGADWEAMVPGYGLQTYKITGLKSPKDLEDEVASLCVWVWSMKDYIKKLATSLGRNPAEVETFVNADPDLPVCADLANGAKHAELNQSRSGQYLRMGDLRYSIPQQAVSSVTFRGNEVQIDVGTADTGEVAVPVLDRSGKEAGEALACLRKAVMAWERLLQQFGVPV